MTEVRKQMNLERWDKTTQLIKMGEANTRYRDIFYPNGVIEWEIASCGWIFTIQMIL